MPKRRSSNSKSNGLLIGTVTIAILWVRREPASLAYLRIALPCNDGPVGLTKERASQKQFMHLFSTCRIIYNMCTAKNYGEEYSRQVYDKYKQDFEEYVRAMVQYFNLLT